MTGRGNNTYLIAGGDGTATLIDAGVGDTRHLAEIDRQLAAHGPRVDDPAALLSGYLEHRRMRERQVIEALQAGHATVQAIAESIYDGLDPALMAAACENVRAHLEKLRAEGRASAEAGRWTRAG